MKSSRKLAALLAVLALVAAACTSDSDGTTTTAGGDGGSDGPATGSVYDTVMSNDEVRCGTRDDLPGFAVVNPDGSRTGFDVEFCKVVAAAVLGDAEKANLVDLATPDRFTALQSGQIDVLIRNTTWTAGRDGQEGATFLTTTFYDGQGMMVNAGEFSSIEDMDGVVVCSAGGTTTEGNAASEASRLGLDWEVRSFEDVDTLQQAFQEGACDGWTSDVSQLTGLRSAYPDGPDALTILPEVFSKEPLGPAVRDGDSKWAQVVDWAIIATIQAEEWGITSQNVDDFLDSDNPSILVFLGQAPPEGAVLDPGLGLPTDFAYQVIKQVGNYGEIFERNLAPLGLERGVNALWQDGGLQYAPPYRG
ncbi:MAG: amino acid ABC transporter substrate-binding protein [Acidimicrobiales bacterium]|jgi:general L-amino acid transport system substrate-binding protein|nr:amino acid ABC transporter substrate-binding protein [Acidimicrobiales bacterium]